MASFLSILETFDAKNFTKKENEIIKYIKKNMREVVKMNIEELSLKVNTGYSAIYGLLKKMNIGGYRDMLIAIASDVEIISLTEENFDNVLKKSYFNIINQNELMMNKDLIQKTLKAIKGAFRIFVIGMGSTSALSHTLALELYRFGFNAFSLDENEEDLITRTRFMNKNDLIIAYSLFGDNEAVNKALALAKNKGVTIIVLSGRDMSKSVSLAHWAHIISVPDQKSNNFETYVNKLLPWMYFTDELINSVWTSGIIDKDFIFSQFETRWE